jgi:hypothetical protein
MASERKRSPSPSSEQGTKRQRRESPKKHELRAILFKIGIDGHYRLSGLETNELAAMDPMALLEALATSPRFGTKLKNMTLIDTKVHLLRCVTGDEPSKEEEADQDNIFPLLGLKTIASLLPNITTREDGALFVYITPLPVAQPVAALAGLPFSGGFFLAHFL